MIRLCGIICIPLYRALLVMFVSLGLMACKGRNGKSFLPDVPGYDNKGRQVFILHKKLLEISGITYIDNRTLSAVNDEDGKIFRVDFSDGKPSSFDFGKKGDYEDLVFTGSNYYVLESKGDISVIPAADPSQTKKINFRKKSRIEFESLYHDKNTGQLILLSKEQRVIEDALVAYSFDPVTERFSEQPVYIISLREVKKMMKDYSAECKPSAAAVHPVLNKLFVIASVGKVLMICSLNGQVEKVFSLNPDVFSQPEGICFSPAGDMFISNEGIQGKATIVKYSFRPPVAPLK